jgi:hypothetical protein
LDTYPSFSPDGRQILLSIGRPAWPRVERRIIRQISHRRAIVMFASVVVIRFNSRVSIRQYRRR